MKKCNRCNVDKFDNEFNKDTYTIDGLSSTCKVCTDIIVKNIRKTCTGCNESKFIFDFYKRSASKDSLSYKCKSCLDDLIRSSPKNRLIKDHFTKDKKVCNNCGIEKSIFRFRLSKDYKVSSRCNLCRSKIAKAYYQKKKSINIKGDNNTVDLFNSNHSVNIKGNNNKVSVSTFGQSIDLNGTMSKQMYLHDSEKYKANADFLNRFETSLSILDCYAGDKSSYIKVSESKSEWLDHKHIVTSNDKNKNYTNNDTNESSLVLLNRFTKDKVRFDIIDLDPNRAGESTDYIREIDLAYRLCNKGLIVSFSGGQGKHRFLKKTKDDEDKSHITFWTKEFNITSVEEFNPQNIASAMEFRYPGLTLVWFQDFEGFYRMYFTKVQTSSTLLNQTNYKFVTNVKQPKVKETKPTSKPVKQKLEPAFTVWNDGIKSYCLKEGEPTEGLTRGFVKRK